jgi:protein-ribulosamine 3-kinase
MTTGTLLPTEILQAVNSSLVKTRNAAIVTDKFLPVYGGCINNAGKIETTGGNLFLKWNDKQRFPGMFTAESEGLNVLKGKSSLTVPDVFCVGETPNYQYLVMSYINPVKRRSDYWDRLGEGLAEIHRTTQKNFGYPTDNYIGSLVQHNEEYASWVSFFREQRLEVQLCEAERRGLADATLRRQFEKLYTRLGDLLPSASSALLHGDLWNGNVIADENGLPALIDPACYFGDREVDLAMTVLFGGFDERFYQSYLATFPVQSGYQERADLYNLYPLMVHVNLFGGSYLVQVKSILARYL